MKLENHQHLYIHKIDENDRLRSDYLGRQARCFKKEEAWGPSPGKHETMGYGRREKEGRRGKQRES